MSEAQKVIKYIAIAFGVFLSVNIIGGIITALFFGFSIFGIAMNEKENEVIQTNQKIVFSQNYEGIENIKVKIGYSKLVLKEGTELKVEAKNNEGEFTAKKSGNTLIVQDEENWYLWNDDVNSEITITIPQNTYFEKIKIEAGSGEVDISDIDTNTFDLQVGAGNVKISNIVVEEKAEIDGGAGKVVIDNSILNNLDLDVGVGEFKMQNTSLLENNDIDAGVGKLEINLKGNPKEYKVITKRGIGSFTIENEEVEDNKIYGDGDNKIKLNAGIGKVSIDFNY